MLYNDILSLNLCYCIYLVELERNDTTDTARSASYLGIHLKTDSETRLRTNLYVKRDYFNLLIVNFPFIRSNIPATPTYGVCIFQLIRHSGADGSYHDFLDRGFLITRKLLDQGLLADKLKSLLWKYILIKRYEIYPFLVITIRSFPRSWLITGIVARVTQ